MRKIVIPSLAGTALVTGLWIVSPSISRAENLTNTQEHPSYIDTELAATAQQRTGKLDNNHLMAQFFYPAVSDRHGVMVQGQGEASAPADAAQIEFAFSSSINLFEQTSGGKPTPPQPPTQATLKPVIDALIAAGVSENAIEVNTSPSSSSSSFPFPFPFPTSGGSAQVIVKLDKPTRERVQQVVSVVGNQKNLKGNLSMQNVSVEYTVNNCQPLVKAAYAAAVKDAQSRAVALAEAMNVKVADIPSIAESPLSNIFGASTACSSKVEFPFFPFAQLKQPYNPSAPAQVQVKKDILATYTIR